MQRLLLTLAVLLALAPGASAQLLPDSCIVTGTLYASDMTPEPYAIVKVMKMVVANRLVSNRVITDTADANGYIRLRLWRNSVAWIYSPTVGLDASPMTGTRLVIPDAATAELRLLPPSTSVPSTYVVAVPNMRVLTTTDTLLATELELIGTGIASSSISGSRMTVTISGGGGSSTYGDSIRVADSLARSRRTFVSRLSAAITLDSSTDGAGRIYYTVSLHPDSVQAFLRDSSMTWMLGRVVQLADSGVAGRGYLTPTQIRTLLAGYSVTGHAHTIADVTGLATALGDTVSYRDRMAAVEGSLAVILDTINAVKGRLASVTSDLNAHISAADAHLPSQTGNAGKVLGTNGSVTSWQPEADPVFTAAAPTLRSKGDTLVDVRQTHLEMPNLTHILTADSNKTICVDGSGRLYLCWKGSGGAAVIVDSTRLMPGFAGQTKSYPGNISMSSGGISAPTGTASAYNVRTDSLRISTGLNMSKQPTASVVAENSAESNISIALEPKGTGAFYLGPKADGTVTGGNARGSRAVDLQTLRSSNTQVSSGDMSFTVGQYNTASGSSSSVFGINNVASGAGSFVAGGYMNTASSADGAVLGGRYNTASGGVVLGGRSNTASAVYSAMIGGADGRATHAGSVVFPSIQNVYPSYQGVGAGKAQTMIVNVIDTTTGAASDTLQLTFVDGAVASSYATNKERFLNIDSGFVWTYSALVSARSDVGDAASFKIEGGIKRVGATTSMVGTPTITTLAADATAATWAVNAVADDTNDALHILVTGAANKRIRWHATVTISMVGF